MGQVIIHSLFTDFDIDLFKSGKHYRLYEKLGAHLINVDGVKGTYFAVWAPSAKSVAVIGDFNFWNGEEHLLKVRWDSSGIWEGFIPGVKHGAIYKYKIKSSHNSIITEKADPYARRCEHPPKTASIVYDYKPNWDDHEWMQSRAKHNALDAPYSVYEVHLGSWKKKLEENRSLSYHELSLDLVAYAKEMNFTHIEFMPIMEYPYDPSWGYQITGYFAPTARLGYPEEFQELVNACHHAGLGVILDWVPSHFPEDAHGLGNFDGTSLYEHPDRKRGYHPDWKSLIFNYGRNEVKSFLISNALFWLDQYHIDGLRVDAVASMLFLDYSREEGEWDANIYGGNENLEAIAFLKEMNEAVYLNYPDTQTIAEESTSFPMVSKPTSIGGLGFGMKWMMGWMHDTLQYFKKEPIYRRHHQNDLTFSMTYAFSENFMLPLSHDEVVYGKSSILGRMPGDDWQKFANLRLLYSYMFTHPGSNLMMMGSEFGQHEEWDFNGSLDWHLTQFKPHQGIQEVIKDLNKLYINQKALHEKQFNKDGFEWISYEDHENSVISYIRKGIDSHVVIICNMTPVVRENYRVGVPSGLEYKLLFNSDHSKYGGSSMSVKKRLVPENNNWNNRDKSAVLHLPPLAALVYGSI
ncbi:1,4-alpha-glucan branching protein GlgB [uncultured Nonlabens sp.]|uniref:1,4-alpha-glucan branching protein GlgB n=1 Tax=uncultured Nonlabens sp. TaxID=859306 RepID=UPI002615D1E0|nr:1,4-alpha-glucan branching protein GlgB [uncultured Nonlabens sp.]